MASILFELLSWERGRGKFGSRLRWYSLPETTRPTPHDRLFAILATPVARKLEREYGRMVALVKRPTIPE
jgi:hypothetical protein